MKNLFCSVLVLLCVIKAQGAIHTETVEYKQGDTTLEGYLAYDDSISGKRPGVLIIHQWMGLTDYEKMRARMLAEMGFVAFCADIYGKGIRPTSVKDAGAQAGKYKGNRELLRARVSAGLDALKQNELVDTSHVAAIGYCFGGTTVLELARSGADLSGVVSFHGHLATAAPAQPGAVKTRILVCAGADDPFVPLDQIEAFEHEMDAAAVHWEGNVYSGAKRSFTNPGADQFRVPGLAYNREADLSSWDAMQVFFKETL